MTERHAAPSRRRKLTPKQRVLKKYPDATLVRDGWDIRAGMSGCFDFAIYHKNFALSFAESPSQAWKLAAMRIGL